MCQGCDCADDCPNKSKMLDRCRKCDCICHAETTCNCECAICECIACLNKHGENNGTTNNQKDIRQPEESET